MVEFLAGLFGFALMTAYWPNISGVATTPRWDVAVLLAVVLFVAPRVRMTAAHWLGALLMGWLLLSLTWSNGRDDGIDIAFRMGCAAVAFAVGSLIKDIRPLIQGAALGIGISSAVAIAQWLGWHGMEQKGGAFAGLFFDRNRLAAAAALVAIGLVALHRSWPWLLPVAPSLMLAPSRAAWIALAAGLLTIPGRSPVLMWSARALAFIAAVVLLHVRGFDPSTSQHIELARDTIPHLTLFGHGLGSFRESFPAYEHFYISAWYGERPEHPHNEWLWLAHDGGVPAFGLALGFGLSLWKSCEDGIRSVLVGLVALSMFEMPLQDPATLVLSALVAGFAASELDRIRDAIVDRGGLLCQGLDAPLA